MARDLSKDVTDGRKTVVRLVGRDVVDVRSVGEGVRLVCDVARERCRVLTASEGVSQGGRLDYSLVGKRLGGGRQDGKLGLVPARQAGGLCCELGNRVLSRGVGAIALCGLLLHSLLDDHALLISHTHAALELLLHDGVLGDKAGGKAGKADLLNAQVVPSSHGSSSPRSVGARVGALV